MNTAPCIIHPILANHDDRGMILHPELWPAWPILPVKKFGWFSRPITGPDCGLGCIVSGRPTKVVLGCIGVVDIAAAPVKSYGSVDELLADGWKVD